MRLVRSHPVLAVHDLDRSAAWYEAVFGCTRDDVVPGHWVFCRSGELHFMLGLCPDVVPVSEIGDHSYLAYHRGRRCGRRLRAGGQRGGGRAEASDRRAVGPTRTRATVARRPPIHGGEHAHAQVSVRIAAAWHPLPTAPLRSHRSPPFWSGCAPSPDAREVGRTVGMHAKPPARPGPRSRPDTQSAAPPLRPDRRSSSCRARRVRKGA